MVRGLYTGWTGMFNEQKRLDIVSNNLANAATVGYKKDSVTNQSFNDLLTIKIKDASEGFNERKIGKMNLGVKLGEVYTEFGQGSVKNTGNTYDLAIEGSGFFNIEVPDKNGDATTEYTRAGNFRTTRDGYLVDESGNSVLGESGKIQIPTEAQSIKVTTDGSIYADGKYVDKLIITDFDDYGYLQKQGDSRYKPVEGANAVQGNALIEQGFLEQSNVNVVSEMVEMIAITRAYEANQKVIQTVDGTLDLAVNSVAKV